MQTLQYYLKNGRNKNMLVTAEDIRFEQDVANNIADTQTLKGRKGMGDKCNRSKKLQEIRAK